VPSAVVWRLIAIAGTVLQWLRMAPPAITEQLVQQTCVKKTCVPDSVKPCGLRVDEYPPCCATA
jgi:hypothetical protein